MGNLLSSLPSNFDGSENTIVANGKLDITSSQAKQLNRIDKAFDGARGPQVIRDLLNIFKNNKHDSVVQSYLLENPKTLAHLKELGNKLRYSGDHYSTVDYLEDLAKGIKEAEQLALLRVITIHTGMSQGIVFLPNKLNHVPPRIIRQISDDSTPGSTPSFSAESIHQDADFADSFLDQIQDELDREDLIVEYSSNLAPQKIFNGRPKGFGFDHVLIGEQCIVLKVRDFGEGTHRIAQQICDDSCLPAIVQLANDRSLTPPQDVATPPSTAGHPSTSSATDIDPVGPDTSDERLLPITYRVSHGSIRDHLSRNLGLEVVVNLQRDGYVHYKTPVGVRVWHDHSGEGEVRVRSVAYEGAVPLKPDNDTILELEGDDNYAWDGITPYGRFTCRPLTLRGLEMTPHIEDITLDWFKELKVTTAYDADEDEEVQVRGRKLPGSTMHVARMEYQSRVGSSGKRWRGCVELLQMFVPNIIWTSSVFSNIQMQTNLDDPSASNDQTTLQATLLPYEFPDTLTHGFASGNVVYALAQNFYPNDKHIIAAWPKPGKDDYKLEEDYIASELFLLRCSEL